MKQNNTSFQKKNITKFQLFRKANFHILWLGFIGCIQKKDTIFELISIFIIYQKYNVFQIIIILKLNLLENMFPSKWSRAETKKA